MSLFSQFQSNAVQVGNDAWWVLEFYKVGDDGKIGDDPAVSLASSDYYATIDATLPSNLEGGSYSITIEGLTDKDYAQIAQSKTDPPAAVAAKLYLLWHDAMSGPASYLTNLAGLPGGSLSKDNLKDALVAVLYVSKVSRKLGALSYDTEIHGVEWAHYTTGLPLKDPLNAEDYVKAVAEIAKRTKVDIVTYPDNATRLTTDDAGSEKRSPSKGKTYAAILNEIASAVETNRNQHGRGMLLIRNGKIHLGPRKYPLEGEVKDLTAATGLLETAVDGASEKDPTAPDPGGSTRRAHFALLLKGRPDIKPGDIVRFDPAPEDDTKTVPGIGAALAGALAGPLVAALGAASKPSVTLAVASVRHRLGKATGFSTEVKGVTVVDEDHPWDILTDKGTSVRHAPTTPAADPGSEAAGAIVDHLKSWTSGLQTIEVGQVRAFHSTTADKDNVSQTETVWEGLQPSDQNPNGSRRLPIDPNHGVRFDMPYATPFAWGKCGLVLPRYPGMRVVLGHRQSLEEDAVDLGALWDSGEGPDSQPGDYWLSLPVDVAQNHRDKINDTDAATPHQGKVTQDLIDAEGNRVIELGSLTVTVGKSKLQSAGSRPVQAKPDGSITIQHSAGGSEIVMLQDGTIRIKGKAIALDAGTGDISLTAANVTVKVTGTMDVS
jgi:hypothetical protein